MKIMNTNIASVYAHAQAYHITNTEKETVIVRIFWALFDRLLADIYFI